MKPIKLLLASNLAFYPMHWEAMRLLCSRYPVRASVIAGIPPFIPDVHTRLGWVDLETARNEPFRPDIRVMPAGDFKSRRKWVSEQLSEIRPEVVWMQAEPMEDIALMVLRHYHRNPGARVVTAVCENIFPPAKRYWRNRLRHLLWQRLDGLLAVATASTEGIRQAGMPESIPTWTLVAGGGGPPEPLEPLPLDLPQTVRGFVVGFAGRLVEEKGWKLLMEAISGLPASFGVAIAGNGPQLDELRQWMNRPELRGRVCYAGLLDKADLWRFYKNLDCLAVPSLTIPRWKEQFGGVVADGLAMGLPIIGSDSGAIPEVIGPAGIIVPEGNAQAIANAISKLAGDRDHARAVGQAAKKRFAEEFSMDAYVRKIAIGLGLIRLLRHASTAQRGNLQNSTAIVSNPTNRPAAPR